jgi:tetratricopeptide (TPR) repeat protein
LYATLLTTADQAFAGKEFNVSRAWYYKALELKPAESYPTDQISKIGTILANMQLSQAEREFQQFIDKGDEAFRSGELAVARSWYNHALGIRGDDQYARSQLTEIQIKINERLQGGTNKTYEAYLEQGDKAFGQKQYSVARVWYQRALQIKHRDETSLQKLEAVRKAFAGETE